MAFDAQLASSYPPLVLYTIGTALRALSYEITKIWNDRTVGRNPGDEITTAAILGIKSTCDAINNAVSRVAQSPIGIHRVIITKKEKLEVKIYDLLIAIDQRIIGADRIATIDDDEEDFDLLSGFPRYATQALIRQRKLFSNALLPQYRAYLDLGLLLNGVKYKCDCDSDDHRAFQGESMFGSDLVLKVNQYLAQTKSCGTDIHETTFAIPDENDHDSIILSLRKLIKIIEPKLNSASKAYDKRFEKNKIIFYTRQQLAYEIFQDPRLDQAAVISKFKEIHKIEYGPNAKLPGSFNGVKKLAIEFQSKHPYLPAVLVRKGGRPPSH